MERGANTVKIKIVKWQGSHSPIWEEIGEIEAFEKEIGWNAEEEELCIDIEDLMNWVNRSR